MTPVRFQKSLDKLSPTHSRHKWRNDVAHEVSRQHIARHQFAKFVQTFHMAKSSKKFAASDLPTAPREGDKVTPSRSEMVYELQAVAKYQRTTIWLEYNDSEAIPPGQWATHLMSAPLLRLMSLSMFVVEAKLQVDAESSFGLRDKN